MLDLVSQILTMGKISNNLEKHGDEHMPGFLIPMRGMRLPVEEAAAFIEDKYLERWAFNTKGKVQEPCNENIEPFKLKHDYENATVTFGLRGDRELEFEGAKIKDIYFWPVRGGMVEFEFGVYLHPGLKKENLLLQEHQHCEIKLSIADAEVALKKKSQQQDLPLEGKSEEKGAAEADAKTTAGKNGSDRPAAH